MAEQEKKTVLSGIQPSGSPTLGNYVGALKNWKLLQTDDRLCYYCVANLHALTVRQDPTDLRRRAGETVALLLACVLTFAMAGQVVWAVGIPADYRWAQGRVEVPIWYWQGHAIWGMTARLTQDLIRHLD